MPCGCQSGPYSAREQNECFRITTPLKRDDHHFHNTLQSSLNWKGVLTSNLPSPPCCIPKDFQTTQTAELDRYIINQPDNYIRKGATIINALPHEVEQLKAMDTVTTFKTRYNGAHGDLMGPVRPPTPPSTTFYPKLSVVPPGAQGPIPEYLGDTRINQRMDATLERPFEWSTHVPQNKISNDRYFGLEDKDLTKNLLLGFVLAVLVILPIVPPL